MIACSLPTAIIAPINLMRCEWDINVLFSASDVLGYAYKLCGLCLLPAQVFTQLKATHGILNRQIPSWIEENREATLIIKIFTDSIAQSNVGITVGGMTVITKSMILTRHLDRKPFKALYGTLSHLGKGIGFILRDIKTADLDTIEGLGYCLQSLFSLIFLIYWQWSGTFDALSDKILLKDSERFERWFRIIKIVTFTLLAIIMCNFIYNSVIYIGKNIVPLCFGNEDRVANCTQLMVKCIRHIFGMPNILAKNITFCIFMVSMASLVIELSDFNNRLEEEFTVDQLIKVEEGKVITSLQVLAYFKSYTKLTEKVGSVDRIFNLYIFSMIACSLPTAIIAPIKLIHSKWGIYVLFNACNVFGYFYRLCGLCLLPAQVFTQLKATHGILNRQIPSWIEENQEAALIIKIFTDSTAQSNVGITVGGMTVITKSMILTCLSLIVPYTLLCLQLKIGSQSPK
ncbi:GUstatory Receptor family [Ditylenchus destructor]|uniref:GUstatory Receptor family n=1 Tax=Ditylenchus destructor TaxID=166010 RepID=A0AAD4MN89_9BILA|nr:GUstatory Receptor family [Ditylenchus destructor]